MKEIYNNLTEEERRIKLNQEIDEFNWVADPEENSDQQQ